MAGLTKSILNDYVSKRHRAKWNALESVNLASWSGSALLGGWLSDRIHYQYTFLVTAGLQGMALACLLPLIPLVAAEKKAKVHTSPRPAPPRSPHSLAHHSPCFSAPRPTPPHSAPLPYTTPPPLHNSPLHSIPVHPTPSHAPVAAGRASRIRGAQGEAKASLSARIQAAEGQLNAAMEGLSPSYPPAEGPAVFHLCPAVPQSCSHRQAGSPSQLTAAANAVSGKFGEEQQEQPDMELEPHSPQITHTRVDTGVRAQRCRKAPLVPLDERFLWILTWMIWIFTFYVTQRSTCTYQLTVCGALFRGDGCTTGQ